MTRHHALVLVTALALTACSDGVVVAPAVDAGDSVADAGEVDAGEVDAGEVDAGEVDAGEVDAGEVDAGEVDAGDADAGDPGPIEVHPARPHWKLAFADEFKGPRGDAGDQYCFEDLLPQCAIWTGSDTNNCDLSDEANDLYPPTRANLVAALRTMRPDGDYSGLSEVEVKALYGALVRERLKDLNKCTWSIYQMLNWMATDYAGHYSARFDASQVTVDPTGRGYLELSATYAPIEDNCAYGGTFNGDTNCALHAFDSGVLKPSVAYSVDTGALTAGVYYAQASGGCPHGGTAVGSRCRVHKFETQEVAPGIDYWVDPDARWPGVYYANKSHPCRDNIEYEPWFGFRKLACPILNGGVLSHPTNNRAWVDPAPGSAPVLRGFKQKRGRFEVKSQLPRGVGAFPAAWLMPVDGGGWPYAGGEIDVVEGRDDMNEVFQTYHHGYCWNPTTQKRVPDIDSPAACQALGMTSVNLSKGFTLKDASADEFWKRDHLYAVEWDENELRWYVNGRHTHTVKPGVSVSLHGAPAGAPATLEASNMPQAAFYWILNHSTWVPADKRAGFKTQVHRIDYVRTYDECRYLSEFCPCGGEFREGVGCVWTGGAYLSCPEGVTLPPLHDDVYEAFCQPANTTCVNGGDLENGRCVVHRFAPGELASGVAYWVDADVRWPGVYYAKINGSCPHGGSGSVNCQALAFGPEALHPGVDYRVDKTVSPKVVSYQPDFPN